MELRTLRSVTVSVLATCVLLVGGCEEQSTQIDTIIGSGNLVSEVRAAEAFQGILIAGQAKVFITLGSVPNLRVEADDNVINRVTTSVAGGNLVISLQQASYEKITVNVYVTMPTVELLEISGAGTYVTAQPIQCTTLTCRISGAGTIDLTGSADNQIIVISGTATITNFGLVSKKCSISISGVGNCQVHVTEELDAIISGIGTVVYDGNPPVVRQTVSGSGTIRPR